ncbi:MAG: hypothetical protein ABIU77_09605 [Ferruginibacter sp.]|jgi:hypothetical protein
MKKIMVCMMVALGTSSLAMAQTDSKFKFSFGPELSLATGAFSDTHSFGIGASVQAEVLLQEHLYGTATFGLISYNGKSYGSGTKFKGETFLPLRVGAKYFLSGGVYGALQAGVAFLNNGGGTAFAYSPQLGYEFKTKTDKAIDASFKYDGYSKNGTLGAVGVRIAYIF